jgi:hypothetical protein
MDKKVLSEINRSREIMGLKRLVIKEVEKSRARVLTEQEMKNLNVWLPGYLQDMREPFWKYLKSHDFDTLKYGDSGVSLAKAIAHAYNKIYGEDMNLDSLHIFKEGFLQPEESSSYTFKGGKDANTTFKGQRSKFGGTDMMVLSNAPGANVHKVTMTYRGLGWDSTEVTLDEAIKKINEHNILKAGTLQIVAIDVDLEQDEDTQRNYHGNYESKVAYKATNPINQLVVETDTRSLNLFSPADVVDTLEGEGGGTITIAANVVRIEGDQAFEDVAVEPNKNVIKKALEELQTQANGKPVKTIKIHSSASNDVISDPEIFRTNAPKYKGYSDEIIQKKDAPNTDFVDLKDPTGNKVLAYLRGQNVAKLLKGIDIFKNADIEYVYSIGGSGNKHQFADLTILAMEDDEIEVLKGGSISKSTSSTKGPQRTGVSNIARGNWKKAYNTASVSFGQNIIDVYKAVFTFDMSKTTKEIKVMADVTRKKKLWPPSEWFKSKEKRTKSKHTGEYTTVDDKKVIKQLTDKQKLEKDKSQSDETL